MSLALLGFDLLRPAWMLSLLAGPLLLVCALWAVARRRRERERLVAPRHLARLVPGWSAGRARYRGLLAALGTLFLALALVGPVRGYTVREVERRGLDLVVAVDTSRSMLAQDLRPDRLGRARREVRGLLQRMGGDRAAILAFAGDVRLVAPLTHDRETLAHLVETLSPADNRVGGTSLGGAIERALALFDGRTGAHEGIVLVTDGEDHEEQGLAAARRAGERGIRIFVVGVGTAAGGKIPDRHQGFLRDAAGQEVISRLEADTLRRIAEASGGAYLAVGEAPFPLERLYSEQMSRLETRELWAGKLRVPHDRFQWPLVVGLACMLLAAGLRERVPSAAREAARGAGPSPARLAPARSAAAVLATRGAAAVGALPPLALILAVPLAVPLALPIAVPFDLPIAGPSAVPSAVQIGGAGAPQEGFAAELRAVERAARAGDLDSALERCDRLLAPTGFARWREGLAETGLVARAVALAEPVWDRLGWNGWPAEARAEVHHARGAALLLAEERARAAEAFHRARGLWARGELAQDATYHLGLAALLEGEAWRAQIPELGGAPHANAPANAPDEEPADPLEQAKAHYLRARAALIQALRLDWRAADTRANVELVQRRLRELEELERQREEQPSEGEEPGEPGEGDEQDSSGEPPEEASEAPSEGESDGESPADPPAEPPDEPPAESGDEPAPEPSSGEEDSPPAEEQPQDDPPQPDGEDEPQPEPPAEPPTDEPHLTREEVQRLLDRLERIEEQAEALREALRRRQRVPVEKDW